MSKYVEVRKAKSNLKHHNRVGWPDSQEGICRLYEGMTEMERNVVLCGRFIRNWRGWVFNIPSTQVVLNALESGRFPRYEPLFVVDEEG